MRWHVFRSFKMTQARGDERGRSKLKISFKGEFDMPNDLQSQQTICQNAECKTQLITFMTIDAAQKASLGCACSY